MRKKIENILVVTMNPTRRCFMGCIGIENDRIAYVGPSDRLQNDDWIRVTSIDAPKRCLALPGFFESHVHVTYLPWRYDKREGRSRAKRATPSEKMGLIKRTRREAVRAGVTFLCDFAPYNDVAGARFEPTTYQIFAARKRYVLHCGNMSQIAPIKAQRRQDNRRLKDVVGSLWLDLNRA